MAYASGHKITAESINDVIGPIKSVYNDVNQGSTQRPEITLGYGQTVPNVSSAEVGERIEARLMNDALLALRNIAGHQGSSLVDDLDDVATGDVVSVISQLPAVVASLTNGRMDPDILGMTLVNKGSTTYTSSWENGITHELVVTFASWDDMRYFFNTGGQIRFSYSLENAANRRALYWYELFNTMGHIIVDHSRCFSTGLGQSFDKGAYDLTETDQVLFEYNSIAGMYASLYGSDLLRVYAKLSDAPGISTSVIITVQFIQGSGKNETVDGVLLTANTQERRANNQYVSVPTSNFLLSNFTNYTP